LWLARRVDSDNLAYHLLIQKRLSKRSLQGSFTRTKSTAELDAVVHSEPVHPRLEPLLEWAHELYYLVFYRQLFLKVDSYVTCILFQLINCVRDCIMFPGRMSRSYFSFQQRVEQRFLCGGSSPTVVESPSNKRKDTTPDSPSNKQDKRKDTTLDSPSNKKDKGKDTRNTRANRNTLNKVQKEETNNFDISRSKAPSMSGLTSEDKYQQHSRLLCRAFYVNAMAQRITISTFAACICLLRVNYNSAFFPFSETAKAPLTVEKFEQLLYFVLIMFACEWLSTAVITLIIRFVYKHDVMKIGTRMLTNNHGRLLANVFVIHIMMDSYMSLNTLDFTWS